MSQTSNEFSRCIIFKSCCEFVLFYRVNLEQIRAANNGTFKVDKNETKSAFAGESHSLNNSEPTLYYLKQDQLPSNDTAYDFWNFSRETSIYIYSVITIATIVVTFIRSISFFAMCMRASRNLHNNMFDSITRATMRFFNTNTSGRILNRFSKDMGQIDELLPACMIDVLQIGLALFGIICIVGVVSPMLMIPTGVIAICFYLLRIFYLHTSRSVKRLEGVSKYA